MLALKPALLLLLRAAGAQSTRAADAARALAAKRVRRIENMGPFRALPAARARGI